MVPSSKTHLFNLKHFPIQPTTFEKAPKFTFPFAEYVEKKLLAIPTSRLDTYRTREDSNLSSYDICHFHAACSMAHKAFRSKMKSSNFKNGSGFRFLTSYDEDYVPKSDPNRSDLCFCWGDGINKNLPLSQGLFHLQVRLLPQTTTTQILRTRFILRYALNILKKACDFLNDVRWIQLLVQAWNG